MENKLQTTTAGIPVFHADHGLVHAHYDFIDRVLEGREDGFFIGVYDLPDACPDLMSALYGPAAGDPPIREEQVYYKVRNERPGPSRLISRPHRPCRRIVICGVKSGDEGSRIFTAYGTQAEKPSPREWWDSTMRPFEALESAKFWSEHALAEEDVQE